MPDHLFKEPPTARQISRGNYNRLVGLVQGLSGMVFDKTQFQITWQGPIPIIRLRRQAGVGTFSGLAWVAGKKYDLTATSTEDWIKVDMSADPVTVAYDASGPASEAQFDDGVEWYRTAQTPGDLHITRF